MNLDPAYAAPLRAMPLRDKLPREQPGGQPRVSRGFTSQREGSRAPGASRPDSGPLVKQMGRLDDTPAPVGKAPEPPTPPIGGRPNDLLLIPESPDFTGFRMLPQGRDNPPPPQQEGKKAS